MNYFLHRLAIFSALLLFSYTETFAIGEPSTYFNIYVPPNATNVKRDVCLIVTAIYDSTTFSIEDDGMDGDTDDSKSGMLMAGQSYILYIRDNGINDDAQYASGGTLKWDGDYFIIHSNNNIYASQSTNSDWQHDWVPGISQSSLSQKFILYSPKVTSSKRDFNVMAYQDNTYITVKKISLSPTIITGYTNVNYKNGVIVFQKMIHRGQDLIYFYNNARDVMNDGETYIIETSKPVTVQYGALFGNERDGGGYVPTNTGSSSGSLAYFAVPYQNTGEQEIRVVSWDAGNQVKLYRYSAGTWILMKDWAMGQRTFQDWVGKSNGNVSYATIFKIECTAGKRVSIFEGNWFETGAPGTSDMATMMSAENGTSAGNYFIAYMAPPGNETSVKNPFTGTNFGGNFTHLYVFAKDTAHIQIRDSYTNGVDFSRTYTILPGRYIDCALNETQWKSIYNGTGTTTGGPKRPYLIVTSDNPVSVMNSNFNDNWMMYFGSSQFRDFTQTSNSSSSYVAPGQQVTVVNDIKILGTKNISNVSAKVTLEGGLKIVSSTFNDLTNLQNYPGTITEIQNTTEAKFNNLPNLSPANTYNITTIVTGSMMDAEGMPIANNSVSNVITTLNCQVSGVAKQSTSISSVALNSYNTNGLLFDFAENTGLENTLTNSWACSAVDYDNDGDDDLFFTDASATQPNKLFKNNGNCSFSLITTGSIVTDVAKSMSSAWADCDNDGDLDVIVANNTINSCFFYLNNGNGTFTKNTSAKFTQNVGYYHHASWVDIENDGQLELYLGNYWPTRFNELWKRDVNGNWNLCTNHILSQIQGKSTGATWCDYDNDGLQDLLLLDNEVGNNRMYHNTGNGNFESVSNAITQHGGKSVASTWGDIDNDGDMDLFISNASNFNNELYINQGYGQFNLVQNSIVVSDKGHSHGCSFVDVDKDADLDLYVANDQGVKFLYLNDGLGNFTKKNNEWPNSNFGKSYGAVFSDLDLDGDMDLISATHSNQRNFIFTANNNANNWLGIRCVGTSSNKSAVGTRIKIKANGKWQCREINAQNGLGGQNSYRQHFGCGIATTIDSIEIKWPSGYMQYLKNVNCSQNIVITEENTSTVNAYAFFDTNNNCTFDNGETLLEGVKFTINNGNSIAYTDKLGSLMLKLGIGDYNINVSDDNYTSNCSNPTSFSIQSIGTKINAGYFALQPKCTTPNLNLYASSNILRRGFHSKYIITIKNEGLETASNVALTAEMPTSLSIDSTSVAYNSISNRNGTKLITWNLNTIAYTNSNTITIYYYVPPTININDELTFNFNVSLNEEDCNQTDNAQNDLQNILGSVDPNDILAFPKGKESQHYISNKQDIKYRIRFQNVGNYYAEFVTINDELPYGFDMNSIRHITASHPVSTTIQGNKISFYFPNILLPDSTTNSIGSNGFVEFIIAQDSKNKNALLLENKATIQFDYNEFINTNTVFHTVSDENVNMEFCVLVVNPNPATNFITVKAAVKNEMTPELISVTIFNAEGTEVMNRQINAIEQRINISNLNSGLYLIQAQDIFGRIFRNKLIVTR